MNNSYRGLILSCIIIFIYAGCTDIFEDDISSENVELLGPADSLHTTIANMTFWWSKIDGAQVYNFQLVTPSFNKVELILMDTTITSDKFIYSLSPGTYQWRVCGLDGSSSTKYSVSTLFVDQPVSLSKKTPQMMVNGTISNSKK